MPTFLVMPNSCTWITEGSPPLQSGDFKPIGVLLFFNVLKKGLVMASSAETSCLFYLVLHVAYDFEKIHLQTFLPHKIGITLPQGWFIKFLGVPCIKLQNVIWQREVLLFMFIFWSAMQDWDILIFRSICAAIWICHRIRTVHGYV